MKQNLISVVAQKQLNWVSKILFLVFFFQAKKKVKTISEYVWNDQYDYTNEFINVFKIQRNTI